ncbi:MAG: aminopeptidase P N-terminal domain-containing protein [Bacteroidales bacterium]
MTVIQNSKLKINPKLQAPNIKHGTRNYKHYYIMTYYQRSTLFKKNRQKLAKTLQAGETAIVVANLNYPRNGDQFYPFRQDSDFFWLTGINQDCSYLILHKDKTGLHENLLIKETSDKIRLWDGPRLNISEAKKISGIQNVYWLDKTKKLLKKYIEKSKIININKSRRVNTDLKTAGDIFLEQYKSTLQLSDKTPGDICPRIHKLRVIKEPEEIEFIRKAIDITQHAYLSVLQQLKPEMTEYQAEAIMRYEMQTRGAGNMSFAPILASGENACILHYIKNNKTCKSGDLLLMDFGAEFNLYPADCSRTIPVNGKYTARQKLLYNAVLDVYNKAIKLFKPGETINGINEKTGKLMEEKLLELGLLTKESIKNADKNTPAYKQFFPHGTTHFIGLDVHDVGDKDMPFEPGMVMSCEPGIYIQNEGIGIRIETDVLITENGCEDLMADFPVKVEDIENTMRT